MDDLTQTPPNLQENNRDSATTIISVEGSIKTHMSQIERTKGELKKQKEMLDSILDNDQAFKEATEVAKKAAKEKSRIKQTILKKPDVAHLDVKVREIKDQLRDLKEGLSSYLAQYQMLTGSNQFEGDDGQLREIVYVAKLVIRSEK